MTPNRMAATTARSAIQPISLSDLRAGFGIGENVIAFRIGTLGVMLGYALLMFVATVIQEGAVPARQPAQPPPTTGQSGPTEVRPPLTIGSLLPLPEIDFWARGSAPDFTDPSQIFLINFWSSKIAPARESLGRLSKLADDYGARGLVIVGVTDEPLTLIQPLLESPRYHELVRFAIGCDPDRSVYQQLMAPAWQNSLPTAFLAQRGKILWIGNPRDVGDVIRLVVAGTWSAEGRSNARAESVATTSRATAFDARIADHRERKNWDGLVVTAVEMAKDSNPILAQEGVLLHISSLQQLGRVEDALSLSDTVVGATTNWRVAAAIASTLVAETFERPDLTRASAAALKAIELSKRTEAIAYCALADVQARAGELALATISLDRAMMLALPEETEMILDRTLQLESRRAAPMPAPMRDSHPATAP
ncbi:MAG: redoxin domain-containing protein [Phycisphaerales bacterium]|nr:redoxin domain-containing protein [Phycisphaerales bacterium]